MINWAGAGLRWWWRGSDRRSWSPGRRYEDIVVVSSKIKRPCQQPDGHLAWRVGDATLYIADAAYADVGLLRQFFLGQPSGDTIAVEQRPKIVGFTHASIAGIASIAGSSPMARP